MDSSVSVMDGRAIKPPLKPLTVLAKPATVNSWLISIFSRCTTDRPLAVSISDTALSITMVPILLKCCDHQPPVNSPKRCPATPGSTGWDWIPGTALPASCLPSTERDRNH